MLPNPRAGRPPPDPRLPPSLGPAPPGYAFFTAARTSSTDGMESPFLATSRPSTRTVSSPCPPSTNSTWTPGSCLNAAARPAAYCLVPAQTGHCRIVTFFIAVPPSFDPGLPGRGRPHKPILRAACHPLIAPSRGQRCGRSSSLRYIASSTLPGGPPRPDVSRNEIDRILCRHAGGRVRIKPVWGKERHVRRILMTALLLGVGSRPLAAQEAQTAPPPRWDARVVGPLPRMGITSLEEERGRESERQHVFPTPDPFFNTPFQHHPSPGSPPPGSDRQRATARASRWRSPRGGAVVRQPTLHLPPVTTTRNPTQSLR
jgi:hypothetical protein